MNSRIETPHEWGERHGKPESEATFAASNCSAACLGELRCPYCRRNEWHVFDGGRLRCIKCGCRYEPKVLNAPLTDVSYVKQFSASVLIEEHPPNL